ncbi:hypothetical protein PI125_g10798 [Phytophthora idaei]|nr:hypothetical protein PI125_g10798 [Phytophthora idaei]KAG3153276.1 hypothetical protein PI126_g10152 [Phytophthora idaei]
MIRLEHILPRTYHHRSRSDHPLRQRGTAAACKALCKCPRKKLHGSAATWLEHWIRLNVLPLFLLTVALLPRLNS